MGSDHLAHEGRWIHRIIPDIEEWTSRRHEIVTFYLTQVLTRHGSFGSYLKRVGVYEYDAWHALSQRGRRARIISRTRFKEERERYRASRDWPLSPEAIRRYYSPYRIDRTDQPQLRWKDWTPAEENKRKVEPATEAAAKAATAHREVMPNGGLVGRITVDRRPFYWTWGRFQ